MGVVLVGGAAVLVHHGAAGAGARLRLLVIHHDHRGDGRLVCGHLGGRHSLVKGRYCLYNLIQQPFDMIDHLEVMVICWSIVSFASRIFSELQIIPRNMELYCGRKFITTSAKSQGA